MIRMVKKQAMANVELTKEETTMKTAERERFANYPNWIWESYDKRPRWAAEATIHEWADYIRAKKGMR